MPAVKTISVVITPELHVLDMIARGFSPHERDWSSFGSRYDEADAQGNST